MADYPKFTRDELKKTIDRLLIIFDVVRIVNPSTLKVVTFHSDGTTEESHEHCFAVWKHTKRCENCISARIMTNKNKLTKFEFVGDEIYNVDGQYVEVDGKPYVLEVVCKSQDFILNGAFQNRNFVHTISEYADLVYSDSLTKIHNRRYYDEQMRGLTYHSVVMVDVDNFKEINDQYGHLCGDLFLQQIALTLQNHTRRTDCLVRYGGDEFLIAFPKMDYENLVTRLERIRSRAEQIHFDEYPDAKVSLSIGAVQCDHKTISELLPLADKALYVAKEKKNTVFIDTKVN